ncbi:MAG: M23 family metallopeptidase [Myxococcota bacterium]
MKRPYIALPGLLLALAGSRAAAEVPRPSEDGPSTPRPIESLDGFRYHAVEIQKSLAADIVAAVGKEDGQALTQVVKRALVWWLDPRRDLRRGDRLEMVWRSRPGLEPVVEAVWLRSEKLRADKVAVLHRARGASWPTWVDPERGEELERRLVDSPVQSYEQITSLLNDGRGHRGVDFKAPMGTPVVAPFAGEVVRVNWGTRSNGRCVKIVDRRRNLEALFLHLSKVDPAMKVGRRVRKGDRIGDVGNTGRSFAPHLHYQLERAGRVVDPFRAQKSERVRLSSAEKQRAKVRLRQLEALRTTWK